MLQNISRNMLVMLLIYLFSLAYGLNFVVSAAALGIAGLGMLIIAVIVFLPAIFFALYFLRGMIELLYGKESLLRILAYVFTILSVVFVTIFIIPISY